MTASLATTVAMPPSGGEGGVAASQNLFEHMANNAKGMPEGASPHQIGQSLMDRLDGFIERSRTFSERVDALGRGDAPSPPTAQVHNSTLLANHPAESTPKVEPNQVDQIVHSLGRMFDYSIETQMVVRGATQVSGSANTLLKGQ